MARIVHFYYFRPGNSQCRIYYGGPHDLDVNPNLRPADSYKAHPQVWKEVGLLDYKGHIVCLAPHHPNVLKDMKDCEPLMGGATFRYSDQGEPT